MPIVFNKSPSTKKSKFQPGQTRENWTDKKEILNPGLMIAYRSRATLYPPRPVREFVVAAAAAARRIMRVTVRQMDRVVFFRQKEGQAFTNIMNYHFGLAANRFAGHPQTNVVDKTFALGDFGKTDRRWALNKIREGMLSISFHLNTGMYLIDSDIDYRSIRSGMNAGAVTNAPARDGTGQITSGIEEGYCTYAKPGSFHKGLLSGFKNGEIHVSMGVMHELGYSYENFARVIIHEAAHKFLAVVDKNYAHQADYATMSFRDAIDNADSFAWAAISLDAGGLVKGLNSRDATIVPAAIA